MLLKFPRFLGNPRVPRSPLGLIHNFISYLPLYFLSPPIHKHQNNPWTSPYFPSLYQRGFFLMKTHPFSLHKLFDKFLVGFWSYSSHNQWKLLLYFLFIQSPNIMNGYYWFSRRSLSFNYYTKVITTEIMFDWFESVP